MYVDAVTGVQSQRAGAERPGTWVSLVNDEVVAVAGAWRRFGAAIVDILIPVAAASVVSVVALIIHIPHFVGYGHDWGIGWPEFQWLTNLKSMLWGVWVLFPSLAAWYGAWRTSQGGRSWSERASGIETVRAADGRAPELTQALTRSLLPVCVAAIAVSAVLIARPPRSALTVLLIGGACWLVAQFSTALSRLGQGWNDIAAQTVTVDVHQIESTGTAQDRRGSVS